MRFGHDVTSTDPNARMTDGGMPSVFTRWSIWLAPPATTEIDSGSVLDSSRALANRSAWRYWMRREQSSIVSGIGSTCPVIPRTTCLS